MTQWQDYPSTRTPITAAALNDLEQRINTANSTANRTSETIRTSLDSLKTEIRSRLATSQIRMGTITVSNVPRLGFAGLSVTFDRPFSSSNYIIILTIGGSGNASPELMAATYSTGGKTNKGFFGRVRNNANSPQSCEVSYIAIEA